MGNGNSVELNQEETVKQPKHQNERLSTIEKYLLFRFGFGFLNRLLTVSPFVSVE